MSDPFIDRITDHMGDGQVSDVLPVEVPYPDAARKYLAFVNHELNNNLSGVLLFLHVLRQQVKAGDVDCESVGDLLDTATQVVQDTVTATRRFLHIERARHAGTTPESAPVHLSELVRRLSLQFATEANVKGLTLAAAVPSDAVVVSNRELILLVLQNLVGNAVKFSHSGTVTMGADVNAATRSTEALWVSDEGPGIPSEQLPHIFTAFARAESDGAAGVGLGLTVAAEASRLLGARLTVKSHPSSGTTFYLEFPQDRHVIEKAQ